MEGLHPEFALGIAEVHVNSERTPIVNICVSMNLHQTPPISPEAILSGIGSADRELIATYLGLLVAGDGLAVMKGAVKDLGKKLRLFENDAAAQLKERVQAISRSTATDDELRHQLWFALTESLRVKGPTPFSRRSGRTTASALAVRTSERLSPAIREARRLEEKRRKPFGKIAGVPPSPWNQCRLPKADACAGGDGSAVAR